MALEPESVGRLNAGSLEAMPEGGAMLYVKVPAVLLAKLNVKVPTAVTVVFEPDCE